MNGLEVLYIFMITYPLDFFVFCILLYCIGFALGRFSISERKENRKHWAINSIDFQLKQLVKIFRLRKPGLVYLTLWQGENGMLKFVLVLPEKGAADVVQRELTVSVGDKEPVFVTVDGDAVRSSVLEGEDGEAVTGTLVDVDDAGNKSEAREFSFVLADTIAPPMPGEVGLEVTEEV